MRHLIFIILTGTIFSINVNAQVIKRTEPDLSDYIPLLNAAGYEVFTFDIASLKDETYNIQFTIREYTEGTLVYDSSKSDFVFSITNRTMISGFPEESQKKILSEGLAYDLAKGIYTLGEKISIGFTPSADSLKTVTMSIENMGSLQRSLSLKPLTASKWKGKFMYGYRPFKVSDIQFGCFTPLLMVGSYWYDDKFDIVRFCGENELSVDLSSEMLSLIPHYYVIGIIVTKK